METILAILLLGAELLALRRKSDRRRTRSRG
jgi:hypothetical protein